MTSLDDLLFLENDALISALEEAVEHTNQEFAHELGDQVLLLLLLRSVEGEVSAMEASAAIEAYQQLNRGFA